MLIDVGTGPFSLINVPAFAGMTILLTIDYSLVSGGIGNGCPHWSRAGRRLHFFLDEGVVSVIYLEVRIAGSYLAPCNGSGDDSAKSSEL